jgi:hypothetical protein
MAFNYKREKEGICFSESTSLNYCWKEFVNSLYKVNKNLDEKKLMKIKENFYEEIVAHYKR